MGSSFHDATFIHDHNQITVHDVFKFMGNDDRGAVYRKSFYGLLYRMLVIDIKT